MPSKPEENQDQQENAACEENKNDTPAQNQQDEPVVREVTQTDRLNKKLLSSLLERMNSNDSLIERFNSSQGNNEANISTDQDEFAP